MEKSKKSNIGLNVEAMALCGKIIKVICPLNKAFFGRPDPCMVRLRPFKGYLPFIGGIACWQVNRARAN
jgi:hypothetical protein